MARRSSSATSTAASSSASRGPGAWQADIGSYADARQPGRLGTVGGLATDRAGHLYVLDSENDRVQVFDASSGQWLAAWGTRGTAEGRFRLGANTGAGGLAVDHPAAGALPTVYVADQNNHRVQAFRMTQSAGGRAVLPAGDRSGDVVDAPVPVEVWGSLGDCSTVGCAQPAFDDRLNYPQGIAVDPQPDAQGRRHVWVADDRNHRVVEYLPDGTYLRQIGSFGAGPGQFEFPYDVGIDARAPRQLYVLDNNNHRVQAFDVDTLAFAREWGLFGPQPGAFEYPRALAALADDPVGGVAVADNANNRVQTFGADGSVQAVWGIAGRGPGYVSRPGGLAIDAAGTIHIADTLADRLQRLGPDGAYAGQSGYISTRSGYAAPRDGPGEFDVPAAVVHDPLRGSIWVADTGNDRIQQLRPDGTWVATYTGGLSGPRAVAVDPGGRILVADTGNDRVQRLDPATGAWSTVALGGATVTRAVRGRGDRRRHRLRRRQHGRPDPRGGARWRGRAPPGTPGRRLRAADRALSAGAATCGSPTPGTAGSCGATARPGPGTASVATAGSRGGSWRRRASPSPSTAGRWSWPTAATTGSSASR